MAQTKFRSLPLRESPSRVDRDARVIYGASAAQAVEALGHNMILDAKTIQQIVDLGNATRNGIKSRYTHPGLSSDGMGKQLGRMKNFRIEGDKAVGDLHFYASASNTPNGDLAGHVMDLAEEDSEAFGMSVVIEAEQVWTLDDGTETPAESFYGDDEWKREQRPKNALTDIPVARVKALFASDVVDEPAANRDGMFSAALWGTNQLGEEMFGEFDGLLAQVGMTPERAWTYALQYFDARKVDLKGLAMTEQESAVEATEQDEEIVVAVEIENEGDEDEVTQEEFQAVQAELAALRGAKEQAEQLQAQMAIMQKEARAGRFQKLATAWQGEIAAHMTILEALGEGSEAFGAYCTLLSALSAQIESGDLFKEKGKSLTATGGGSALDRLSAEANKIMLTENITYSVALSEAAKRNSTLYAEYADEVRGN